MLSLICYAVSAFFFLFHALNEQIKDWNMVGWGLFFLAVGHVLDHVGGMDMGRRGRDRDML